MSSWFKVSKVTWLILIIIITVFLGMMWFFNNLTKVSYEKNIGYSEEAKRNPFLAAEFYLKKLNIKFENKQDFSIFDSEIGQYDTILINNSRVGVSAKQREQMLAWVKQGGHLVLLATEFYEYDFNASRDKFLDELGVRYYPFEKESFSSEDEDLTYLTFSGYEKETEIHFHSSGYIDDTSGDASFKGGTDYAEQLIQYDIEEGLVTVLVDFSIWNNQRIDKHDHALFLSQLIGSSEKAWLISNRLQPSLLALMIKYAPLVVISFVIILVTILFSQVWRRGASRQDDSASQREIMQHIAAAGEFSYRNDNGGRLIRTLIEMIDLRMIQLVHGYKQLSLNKRLEKLSEITQLDKSKLAFLWEQGDLNQETFLKKVQLVQDIRKQL
ncbi:DUF4350 domain-containing protein [Aliikangiella sp. IMCC44359]|uniref:DUF4350 domain-containing protein n=1 Tax=Aliikangiella sp. IMCC44359 TaxID=3459125 RepID=UPI00403AAABF